MKISLIIPAYCVSEHLSILTRGCIKSLEIEPPDELIIVDNGSPIPLPEGPYTLIRFDENQGYVGAANAGLSEAHGDIIIVGNNDLIFSQGWRKALLDVFEAGFDVASLRTPQDLIPLQGVQEHERINVFYGMTRKVWETVGPLDPQFVNGAFADTDYCESIKQAGFKIGINWDFMLFHFGSETFTAIGGSNYGENHNKFRKKWGRDN